MDPKKIARINELAKKKKTEGLTLEEKVEAERLENSCSGTGKKPRPVAAARWACFSTQP